MSEQVSTVGRIMEPQVRTSAWPTGQSLFQKHFDAARAAQVPDGSRKFVFNDRKHGATRMPLGQFLLAAEHCGDGHVSEMFGDPCYCGSDNCGYCRGCGMEDHD